jgi:hypothetical protein
VTNTRECEYPFKDAIVVILLLVKVGGGGFGATMASNHSITYRIPFQSAQESQKLSLSQNSNI